MSDTQWEEEGVLDDDEGPGIFAIKALVYLHSESAAAAVETSKAIAGAMGDVLDVVAVRMVISRETVDSTEGFQA